MFGFFNTKRGLYVDILIHNGVLVFILAIFLYILYLFNFILFNTVLTYIEIIVGYLGITHGILYTWRLYSESSKIQNDKIIYKGTFYLFLFLCVLFFLMYYIFNIQNEIMIYGLLGLIFSNPYTIYHYIKQSYGFSIINSKRNNIVFSYNINKKVYLITGVLILFSLFFEYGPNLFRNEIITIFGNYIYIIYRLLLIIFILIILHFIYNTFLNIYIKQKTSFLLYLHITSPIFIILLLYLLTIVHPTFIILLPLLHFTQFIPISLTTQIIDEKLNNKNLFLLFIMLIIIPFIFFIFIKVSFIAIQTILFLYFFTFFIFYNKRKIKKELYIYIGGIYLIFIIALLGKYIFNINSFNVLILFFLGKIAFDIHHYWTDAYLWKYDFLDKNYFKK